MATGGERFKAYKTKGLDVEEVRRRKVEEGVQLRKTNRDDQVGKFFIGQNVAPKS